MERPGEAWRWDLRWVFQNEMGKELNRLRRAMGIAGGNQEIMELKMDRDLYGHVIWIVLGYHR